MENLVTFPDFFFPDKVYKNLETVYELIQTNEVLKIPFLLIPANKDSLCLGIQTYFS